MKILVPVDGSKYSMEAVGVAAEIGKAKGAQVILMTVVPFVKGLDLELSADKWADLEASFKQRGDDALAKAGEVVKAEGVSGTTVSVSSASAADEIMNVATNENVDLIVLGNRGLGGATTRFFMGSVASKVVTHAPCSVYVVKTT